jgi:hypothetical protein
MQQDRKAGILGRNHIYNPLLSIIRSQLVQLITEVLDSYDDTPKNPSPFLAKTHIKA